MPFACLSLLALSFSTAARADDATDARVIVTRAIKAAGIPTDGKPIAMTWKDKGKFTGGGFEMAYTGDWAYQGPDKYRFAISGEFGGMKVDFLVMVNGNKAWESGFGMSQEMTGEKLDYILSQVYQFRVLSLAPLLAEKDFKLTVAGNKDVNGKKWVGVRVERERKPTITLYFDKETGLLAKGELKVKDEFNGWKEAEDETFFEDYKDIGGRKYYTKMRTLRDGKSMIETTLSEQKPQDKLAPKLFEAKK
jgi:outer membrane lipoprotein-sorting protein